MRIQIKTLENAIEQLNVELATPETPWTQAEGEKKANIGNFHLSQTYGGYSLHQMSNANGATQDVFRSGHVPKRELYGMIRAMLAGIDATMDLAGRAPNAFKR
jgi:hypothetical protein